MFTARRGRLAAIAAVAVGAVVALAGCASGNPLGGSTSGTTASKTLVIGSQDYYSNEIIAEIYAQALEKNGYTVDRQFRIGQREVYLPDITSGKIDVFPEYTGSLLQALDKTAAGGTSDATYAELKAALPAGLRVLDKAAASDQNSWTVTQAFAKKYNLTDIASLKNVTEPIYVGGNSELQTRPYGPKALADKYGIKTAADRSPSRRSSTAASSWRTSTRPTRTSSRTSSSPSPTPTGCSSRTTWYPSCRRRWTPRPQRCSTRSALHCQRRTW
jgi:osmoprotectant transport system substrate-binding protein